MQNVFGNARLSSYPLHGSRLQILQAVTSVSPPPSQAPGVQQTPARSNKKKNKKNVDINGEVSKDLGNGMFYIKLENGVTVTAHLSGKIRQNRIKIVGGDKVTVELSPYDLTKVSFKSRNII
jgi:translation initiation factor IF-1